MNPTLGAALAVITVLAILVAVHVPLGTWIHRVFTATHDTRLERAIYRLVGVDARTERRWSGYALSALAFSAVSIVGLWLLIVLQGYLPWSLSRSMKLDTALNTAVSFVTNTNWQSYAGAGGAGYLVQAAGFLVVIILIMAGLTYFPSLALGSIAEALQMATNTRSGPDHTNVGTGPLSCRDGERHESEPVPTFVSASLAVTAWRALPLALTKLDLRHLWRSLVMFVVGVGSVLTTMLSEFNTRSGPRLTPTPR